MIPQDPVMAVTVEDAETGLVGYVVIHNFGSIGGCGGVRALPDVSLSEVKELARAMAYKYAFFRLQPGGAKAGIRMDYDTPAAQRRTLVESFGRHIALLLSTRAYMPWTDMNFNGDDLEALYAGASLSTERIRTQSSQRTALSTFGALCATAEHLGILPQDCRIALEGFGNVGAVLAELIHQWGGRVVGISNTLGVVINDDGLDVSKLLSLRRQLGQRCLCESGKWQNADRAELFQVQADLLVPGARVHAIDEHVASQLQVRAIVPAANVPCTPSAETALEKRGIMLLPDFVVNGGGVLGILAGDGSEQQFFQTKFKDLIARLLKISEKRTQSPMNLARAVADHNYRELDDSFLRQPSRSERIWSLLGRLPLMPDRRKKQLADRKEKLADLLSRYFTSAHAHAN